MTKREPITVTCPNCGQVSDFILYETINADIDPDLQEAVLLNTWSLFVCPHCQEANQLEYPLLYHDMTHQLMISYVPQPNQDHHFTDLEQMPSDMQTDFANYQLRVVHDRDQLTEKAHIFAAGYDDRLMELTKLSFTRLYELPDAVERFYFAQGDDEAPAGYFALITADQVLYTPFPADLYQGVREEFPEVASERTYTIDQAWALDRLMQHSGVGEPD